MNLPWKYGATESILMEWSFGASWIEDEDIAFTLFLPDKLSMPELALELDVCNWFDFVLSKKAEFGF